MGVVELRPERQRGRRPTLVDWIVVEHTALNPKDQALLARLTRPGGGFEVIDDQAGVTVARRISPAREGDPGAGSLVPP